MATLLLRLAGPMQAWGADESKFEHRMTGNMPTKSAVIGMVAAAMGRRRNESISDLASMRFGVRADQLGGLLSDYHTVHRPDKSKFTYITNRQYLEDACFLVGLESELDVLASVADSLMNPYYPLFLGRRACPPSGRLVLGMRDMPLQEALKEEEWLASKWYAERMDRKVKLDMAVETNISK